MRDDVDCPYCGEPCEINHDEGQGYDEDVIHQQTCRSCDKVFVFTTYRHFSYEASKADCLNKGGKHKWKPTMTHPKIYTRMRCEDCDEERALTPEEKIEHGITEVPNEKVKDPA